MPLNLTKKYPELLDILSLSPHDRNESLRRIFNRDIEDNIGFAFRGSKIYPIKTDGKPDMNREFMHLTTERVKVLDESGKAITKNEFDLDRSMRLHWIRHHIEERSPSNIIVFSVQERDKAKRQDEIQTYIYDKVEKYVIVLRCQRKGGYYLLTAYHLNRPYAEKQLLKKMKSKLNDVL